MNSLIRDVKANPRDLYKSQRKLHVMHHQWSENKTKKQKKKKKKKKKKTGKAFQATFHPLKRERIGVTESDSERAEELIGQFNDTFNKTEYNWKFGPFHG